MIKFGKVIYRNIQEQVAKNTEDIAKIFRRPVLQVKMVEELPEEGEEGILYLLPATDPELGNYYEEYLWIDSAWELIGSSAVDISNMVTTDTEQEITGEKTFAFSLKPTASTIFDIGSSSFKWGNLYLATSAYFGTSGTTYINTDAYNGIALNINNSTKFLVREGTTYINNNFYPLSNGTRDIGTNGGAFKDFHLAGISYFYGANYLGSITNKDNRMVVTYGGADRLRVGNSDSDFATNVIPKSNNTYDLGSSSAAWKNLYLTGGINPSEVQLSNINAAFDLATWEVKTMFVNGITTIVFYAKVSAYMNANSVLFRSNKAPIVIRNFLGRNQAEGTYSSAIAQFMIDTNGDVITLASAAANNEICFTLIY